MKLNFLNSVLQAGYFHINFENFFGLTINVFDLVVDNLASILSKFADDTKVGCEVNSEEDRLLLQEVIDRLMIWAEEWQMEFNASKCKVLHLGKKKKQFSYTMRSCSRRSDS